MTARREGRWQAFDSTTAVEWILIDEQVGQQLGLMERTHGETPFATAALRETAAMARVAEHHLGETVQAARGNGASWQTIADALAIGRQDAHERFGQLCEFGGREPRDQADFLNAAEGRYRNNNQRGEPNE